MFFLAFGYAPENWGIFRDALIEHARTYDVAKIEDSYYGRRYLIEGKLDSPTGRVREIRVVWFIETGEQSPRLVTAYPFRLKRLSYYRRTRSLGVDAGFS